MIKKAEKCDMINKNDGRGINMYSNNYNAVRNMFWNGQANGVLYHLNKEGIEHSLFRALKDYTARTEKKGEDDGIASATKMLKVLVNNKFSDELVEYFNAGVRDQVGYDEWHNKLCNKFVDIVTQSNIRKNVPYGKAQKIVNMTMKTIYCLEGADKKATNGYFDHCHMPLDSFTIEWFRLKLAKEWYNLNRKQEFRIKISADGGPLPKWSNLEFKDSSLKDDFHSYDQNIKKRIVNDKHYHYMFFVTMIRAYFDPALNENNPYNGLTPFQAEFYIWPEIQWEMAAKSLVEQKLLNIVLGNSAVSVNNSCIHNFCEVLRQQVSDLIKIY